MLKDSEEIAVKEDSRLVFSLRAIRLATASVLHSAGLVEEEREWTVLGRTIEDAKTTCMCGDPMVGHTLEWGHVPVSMFDHCVRNLLPPQD
jgi:hypothetical protein